MSKKEKISIDRIVNELLIKEYELGPVFAALKFVEDKNIKTAYITKEAELRYNPEFLEQENPYFVILHEILHYILSHFSRESGKNKMIWNVACDMAVNSILLNSGYKWKKSGISPADFNLPDLRSAEYYYSELMKQERIQVSEIVAQWIDEESKNIGEIEISKLAVEILYDAKSRGTTSVLINKILSSIDSNKYNWRDLLRSYVQELSMKFFYDASRKSRRTICTDIYLPKRKRDKVIGTALIAIDVSGSIDDREVQDAIAETKKILETEFVERLIMVQCDTEILDIKELSKYDEVKFERKGRGGTSFIKPIVYAEKNQIPLVIYFSADLDGEFPVSAGIEVIWVTSRKTTRKPPFGKLICI